MEDLDQIIYHGNVSAILNLLDGVEASVDNVVWLATTNRPERLEQNIKNRPSRFDRRFEFKDPDITARRAYLASLIKERDYGKYDLDVWSKDTEGFSFAHMKELFISVVIFGNSYADVIAELKGMGDAIHSDEVE
jgi:SpoVK/Ycf46/Vps4 family AAA+-type ATPase